MMIVTLTHWVKVGSLVRHELNREKKAEARGPEPEYAGPDVMVELAAVIDGVDPLQSTLVYYGTELECAS